MMTKAQCLICECIPVPKDENKHAVGLFKTVYTEAQQGWSS